MLLRQTSEIDIMRRHELDVHRLAFLPSGTVTISIQVRAPGLAPFSGTTSFSTVKGLKELLVAIDASWAADSKFEQIETVVITTNGTVYCNEGYDYVANAMIAGGTPTVNSIPIYANQTVDLGNLQLVLSAPAVASTASVREAPAIAVNLTASTAILAVPGEFLGYHVNSTTSGVIKFWANSAASGTAITGNVTPAAGACPAMPPVAFSAGLYFQLVSGTIDITVFYRGA